MHVDYLHVMTCTQYCISYLVKELLIQQEMLGEGGMRIAKKAEILEGCNHRFLQKFPVGSFVVVKQYGKNVEKAASESERTLMSIAKRVNLISLIKIFNAIVCSH